MYCGFGGITSGLTRGKESASDFLRFLLDLRRAIEFEFGSCGSSSGGAFLGEAGAAVAATGGEEGGMEDGGDIEVTSMESTSTDGERGLFSAEDSELGEGESSGAGAGGGRMK